jgi:hypothetical protein
VVSPKNTPGAGVTRAVTAPTPQTRRRLAGVAKLCSRPLAWFNLGDVAGFGLVWVRFRMMPFRYEHPQAG